MLNGIIFDFDGVIAESVKVKTDAFVELYKQYESNIVEKVLKHHEANGGMSRFEKIKFYHESFLNKTITDGKISELANQFSGLVVEKVIAAPYVPGVLEYIKKSHEKYKLFISTGTPTAEIKHILKERGIAQYFTAVFGSPEEKNDHINHIISTYGMRPNTLVFYGDSNVDHDAAENAQIPFVLIKNAFNKSLIGTYKGRVIDNFTKVQ